MDKPLNPKQQKFVERYLATGDVAQSYIDAGYTTNRESARKAGARLLTNVAVARAVETANVKAAEAQQLTAEWVIGRMQREARFRGKGSSHSARVKALELLGRRFDLFPHRHEHTGKNGGPIRVNLSKVSDADLERLDAILAAAEEPADAGTGAGGAGPA